MGNVGRWWIAGTAAAVAIVLAWVALEKGTPVPVSESYSELEAQDSTIATTAPQVIIDTSRQSSPTVSVAPAGDGDQQHGAFRTDAAGELVIDEQTRVNIEALIADSAPRALYAAVREQTESLPPAAARQAEELVDKYILYRQVQRQTYPAGQQSLTVEDAVTKLEGLQALREAHLGADVARRFFSKEDALWREMIEVMRIENDNRLTAQEKLERAQALRKRLRGVEPVEQ